MICFSDYLVSVRSQGRYHFTIQQAVQDLNTSKANIMAAAYRMRKQGALISPARGLYVIVLPEHRQAGCIPAEDLVPLLMQYWNVDCYYAGLLTAALYHGASHQKPQVFQIVLNKRIKRQLQFGQIYIDCIHKHDMTQLPIQDRVVHTGYLKVSSPELTAMDLFLYPRKSGGLNHIATVLSELIEAIDVNKLITLAKQVSEKMWLQRLGYILEQIDPVDEQAQQKITNHLHNYLSTQKLAYVPLVPEINIKGVSRCQKWHVIENTTVGADI